MGDGVVGELVLRLGFRTSRAATLRRQIRQLSRPMPPEFTLTSEPIDDTRQVVAVRGEIDLFTAPELKAALGEAIESGQTRIVVDLGGHDVPGLDGARRADRHGQAAALARRRLTIVNVDQNIAKTFEITGLDQIFTIRATRDEAIAALDADEAPA